MKEWDQFRDFVRDLPNAQYETANGNVRFPSAPGILVNFWNNNYSSSPDLYYCGDGLEAIGDDVFGVIPYGATVAEGIKQWRAELTDYTGEIDIRARVILTTILSYQP